MKKTIVSNIDEMPMSEEYWSCKVCMHREMCSQSILIDGEEISISMCDVFMEDEEL